MSKERRGFDKGGKLMSVDLSGLSRGNNRTDLGALAKELDIPPAIKAIGRYFSLRKCVGFLR